MILAQRSDELLHQCVRISGQWKLPALPVFELICSETARSWNYNTSIKVPLQASFRTFKNALL